VLDVSTGHAGGPGSTSSALAAPAPRRELRKTALNGWGQSADNRK
jgi:hypothetical protein